MSQIFPVTAPIDTPGSLDTFPTHYANKGMGGLHSVGSDVEKEAIPEDRRIIGLTSYVNEITTNQPYGKLSILIGNTDTWIDFPLVRIRYIDSPVYNDFASGRKSDIIIANDYIYICVDVVNNIGVWKKSYLTKHNI